MAQEVQEISFVEDVNKGLMVKVAAVTETGNQPSAHEIENQEGVRPQIRYQLALPAPKVFPKDNRLEVVVKYLPFLLAPFVISGLMSVRQIWAGNNETQESLQTTAPTVVIEPTVPPTRTPFPTATPLPARRSFQNPQPTIRAGNALEQLRPIVPVPTYPAWYYQPAKSPKG